MSKSGSLVFTENDCIRIIEAVKIRNDEVYGEANVIITRCRLQISYR